MIEERIEQLQSELGKVQAELDELKAQMKPKPEDRFVPEIGETFWYVDSLGVEGRSTWTDLSGDRFRLATGNVHRTKEEARRHKASLYLKTPTGPCPKVGDFLKAFNISTNSAIDYGQFSGEFLADIAMWNGGRICVDGYEAELEAKWRKYGWSVTGEPEPEGWES